MTTKVFYRWFYRFCLDETPVGTNTHTHTHLLSGWNHLEAEPPLIIFTWFDWAQPQVLDYHCQRILKLAERSFTMALPDVLQATKQVSVIILAKKGQVLTCLHSSPPICKLVIITLISNIKCFSWHLSFVKCKFLAFDICFVIALQ